MAIVSDINLPIAPSIVVPIMKFCPFHYDNKGAWLSIEAFPAAGGGRLGIRERCYKCVLAVNRKWQRANPDKVRQHNHSEATLYSKFKYAARQYGDGSTDVSVREYMALWHSPCVFGKSTKEAHGVDRIDSNLGYALRNCQPCCSFHNRMKADIFTSREMHELLAMFPRLQICAWRGEEWNN